MRACANIGWIPVVLALVAACEDAEAADSPEVRRADEFRSDRVDEALDAAGRVLQTRGFSPEGEPRRGFLVDQGSAVGEASLRGGSCYAVIAAGSASLRELDLRLFDGEGTEVAKDAHTGPGAALRYCPPHGGTHYVAALATAGTGLYGLRRFAGPTGLDVRVDDLFRDLAPPLEGRADPEQP